MKILVNGRVFDSEQVPVVLVLSDEDKKNIESMDPEAHRYGSFPEGMPTIVMSQMMEASDEPSVNTPLGTKLCMALQNIGSFIADVHDLRLGMRANIAINILMGSLEIEVDGHANESFSLKKLLIRDAASRTQSALDRLKNDLQQLWQGEPEPEDPTISSTEEES